MKFRVGLFVLLLAACSGPSEKSNQLSTTASPYLREHADNPVNWYPWSDETLALAKKEDKPIIVSIGYAACHWCHVMERESFMDSTVAQLMNENFISIKVDREERPDIDQIYIRASEILTGTSGWPLNAFALPDGGAFHSVTYNSKTEWISLLEQVSKSWKTNRKALERSAEAVAEGVFHLNSFLPDSVLRYDPQALMYGVDIWTPKLDLINGGLKGIMKFPMPTVAEFMLQHSYLTKDELFQRWTTTTLDAMMSGGLFDHLGGGFSRYTTDSLWRIPHFEKMLFDNGQLVSLYSHALRQTKNKNYERVIRETLQFIERDMTSPEGGFYSTINADSEGEEGKFYRWTDEELRSIAGEEAFKYYKLYDGVLNSNEPAPDELNKKLFEARSKRTHPSIDKKILTSWNAMMSIGFLDAYVATGDRHYLEVASKNISHIESSLVSNKHVIHSMFENVKGTTGFLDDYAWLAKAYIQLYQCTFDVTWLQKAKDLTDVAVKKFKNVENPMFLYSENGIVEYYDNVIPSSNSVLADVLLSLGEYFEDPSYLEIASNSINHAIAPLEISGENITNWGRLAERLVFSPYQVAITGEKSLEYSRELQSYPLPPSLFSGGTSEDLPLLENKLVTGKTMIYVCKNRTCKLPVDNVKAALLQLK